MADLAEHSEELAELERRVEELETVIGTQKGGDPIDEAVKSIDAQLSARVTQDQRKLFEIYTSHKQLVEQPLQFAASDEDLAMEHLEDIRAMAKQLEELDQLKDQINPAYLSGVCSSAHPAPSKRRQKP
jgi:phage shock protein A